MRSRTLVAASAALAVPLALALATPALAAGGGDPKVKMRGTPLTTDNAFISVEFEYRCATGHTASVRGTVVQGDLVYANRPHDVTPLTCDGDRHIAYLGTYLVGYDENDGQVSEFINAGTRATATVIVTDLVTGAIDVDVDRSIVQPR